MNHQPHTHSKSMGYKLKPTTVKWSICRKRQGVSKSRRTGKWYIMYEININNKSGSNPHELEYHKLQLTSSPGVLHQ